MKILRRPPLPSRAQRRGVALVIVLACVFLLTVVVVAFLTGIGSEVQSSKFYASGSSVKLMAQSATNLVMAEIRDATADGTLCWASQPGMIRTFDTSGKVVQYYKLYSDDSMVTNTFDHTKTLVPDGINAVNGNTVAWYNQKGVYVDLNEPILVNGAEEYPIVYGATKTLTGSTSDLLPVTFSTTMVTTPLPPLTTPLPPIILPSSTNTVQMLGSNKVVMGLPWGFWLNSNTPVNASATNANITNLGSISPTVPNQAAPMPVKWLYTLQDGSIVVPDSDTSASSTVTFTNSTIQPSSGNPIVGRMAFWTDDESCKVNINTAAEGTYWDIPRANAPNNNTVASTEELVLGYNAPGKYEFQRFPGHPAMTSLSTVFLLNTLLLTTPDPTTLEDPNTINYQGLYSILPRLGTGGSVQGTVRTTQGKTFTAVAPAANRLYASPDEFLYQPMGSVSAPLPRNLNNSVSASPVINQTLLKQDRFFLTASGRSPDVNLFNRPRVCIWPISSNNNSTYRSVYDQLIAFCSTMRTDLANPYLYYFQRQDATDPQVDLPANSSASGIGRNRSVLEYLRNLTSGSHAGGFGPIPGFGGDFLDKYSTTNASGGTDRDQILTEIFDYIRSSNLAEPGVTAYTTRSSYATGGSSSKAGIGQVIPIVDTPNGVSNGTQGFGRFQSVQGATLLFIANADGDVAASQPAPMPTSNPTNQVPAGYLQVQAALQVQLFSPAMGSVYNNPNFNMSVTGLDTITAGGSSVGVSPITFHQAYYPSDTGFWGDQLGFIQTMLGDDGATVGSSPVGSFIGPSFLVSKTSPFILSQGTITIQLLTPKGATNANTPVQTVTLTFPTVTLPLPALAPSNVNDYSNSKPYPFLSGPYNYRYFNSPPNLSMPNVTSGPDLAGPNQPSVGGRTARFGQGSIYNSAAFYTMWDVARSVAIPSDPRIVAAQSKPAPALFKPVGNYASTASVGVAAPNQVSGMHTQYTGGGSPYYGDLQGKLVAGINYDNGAGDTNGLTYTAQSAGPGGSNGTGTAETTADVFNPTTGLAINGVAMGTTDAFGTTGAATVLGDWDSGTGTIRDGPYINKADEGDQGSSSYAPYTWKERVGTNNITTSQYSPNREFASAVTLGSLPSEVFANKPWQTLLFRPGPIGHRGLGTTVSAAAGTDNGPPYTTPPDHLLLDLFTMPVVEPYAISEPLSTAGRINMNSLIVPFNYINRDTGLRALLKDERVISIADSYASYYKYMDASTSAGHQPSIRYPVNVDATLSQFYTRRFNNNDIFRSPSEICDIDIVPSQNTSATNGMATGVGSDPNPVSASTAANPTRSAMDAYWNTPTTGHRLTGDNSRERIYSTLYPRLTTKSNTFTVHFRVQSLKPALAPNSPATAWQTWREGIDQITGEYRGSQVIERYVDPNDPSIPDFTDPANSSLTLAKYYRFRVLATKQFAP